MARTALLLSCSQAEADHIRELARAQRQTISGHVLSVLERILAIEDRILEKKVSLTPFDSWKGRGPRAVVLLRCSTEEARRIRIAARRRHTTINNFVLHGMRQNWRARELLKLRFEGERKP